MHGIKASLLFLLVMTAIGEAAAQSLSTQPKASGMETDVTKIEQGDARGELGEHRPGGETKRGRSRTVALKAPFYLKRTFKYLPSNQFESLRSWTSADPTGVVPLARIECRRAHAVAGPASDHTGRA